MGNESSDYESIRVQFSSQATARAVAEAPDRPVAVSSELRLPPLSVDMGEGYWPASPVGAPAGDHRLIDLGEIARGGMGAIRIVYDRSILRQVALKHIDPDFARQSPAAAHLLVEEAQITGQLEHPNIVPVYDMGTGPDGTPMFTMKLLKGQTLGELIAAGDLLRRTAADLRGLLEVFIRVCDAVSFAHSRGVIHRDLKPDNIMIGSYGQVSVMDWGCALLLRTGRATVTQPVSLGELSALRAAPDAVLGTAAYMAPEQARGQIDRIDERTDVFGLGGVLYEILTQQPPYFAQSAMQAILMARKGEIADPVGVCAPGVPMPIGLVDIAMTALARDPARRHPSVAALKEAVESFLRGPWWCSARTYAAGAIVVREGDPGDAAYIIARGSCEAYRTEGESRRVLRRMGPGDVFGETAIITAQPRSASVVALGELNVFVITRGALEAELGMDSWIGSFVRALAARFREAEDRLEQHPRDSAAARVAQAVRVHLAALGGEAPWARLADALAGELGLTPAAVTRLLVDAGDLDFELDLERDVIRRR